MSALAASRIVAVANGINSVTACRFETRTARRRHLAAGGPLVSDANAAKWWVLADAEGNEACPVHDRFPWADARHTDCHTP